MKTRLEELKAAHALYDTINSRIKEIRLSQSNEASRLDMFLSDDSLKSMLSDFSAFDQGNAALSSHLAQLRENISSSIVRLCVDIDSIEPFVAVSEHLVIHVYHLHELISVLQAYPLGYDELRSFLLHGVVTSFVYDEQPKTLSFEHKSDMLYIISVACDCLNDEEVDQFMDILFAPTHGSMNPAARLLLPDVITISNDIRIPSNIGDKGLMQNAAIRSFSRFISDYSPLVESLDHSQTMQLAMTVFGNDFPEEAKSKMKSILAGRLQKDDIFEIACKTGECLSLNETNQNLILSLCNRAKTSNDLADVEKIVRHKEFPSFLLFSFSLNDLFEGISFPISILEKDNKAAGRIARHMLINYKFIAARNINNGLVGKYAPFVSAALEHSDSTQHFERIPRLMASKLGSAILSHSGRARACRLGDEFSL